MPFISQKKLDEIHASYGAKINEQHQTIMHYLDREAGLSEHFNKLRHFEIERIKGHSIRIYVEWSEPFWNSKKYDNEFLVRWMTGDIVRALNKGKHASKKMDFTDEPRA